MIRKIDQDCLVKELLKEIDLMIKDDDKDNQEAEEINGKNS